MKPSYTLTVLLFLSRGEQVRRLMVTTHRCTVIFEKLKEQHLFRMTYKLCMQVDAYQMNMTNGDFVFLCHEPYPMPKNFGRFTWEIPGDPDNKVG